MKKIILIASALLIGCFSTNAQNKKLKEGKVSFKITYDLDADKQQMSAMLPTNVDIYFKGGKSSAESSGGMMQQRTITSSETGDSYTLMELMGQKVALKMTKGEAVSKISAHGTPEIKITKESKEIAGYKCTKAVVSVKGEPSFDIWFTKELEGINGGYARYEGIDGMMLEYEVHHDGIGMKYSCTAISNEKVDDAKFVIPSDYRPIAQDDLQHMRPEDRSGN